MEKSTLSPNEGKNLVISTSFGSFARYPVKTRLVCSGDDLAELLRESALPYLLDGDMIFMSEKIVAISQGRAFCSGKLKLDTEGVETVQGFVVK